VRVRGGLDADAAGDHPGLRHAGGEMRYAGTYELDGKTLRLGLQRRRGSAQPN